MSHPSFDPSRVSSGPDSSLPDSSLSDSSLPGSSLPELCLPDSSLPGSSLSESSGPGASGSDSAPSPRFRRHDAVTGPFASRLQRRMAEEWVDLNRDVAGEVCLARWARDHPVLAACRRPADVIDLIDRGDYAVKDAVLITLLELFQAGGQLAGRIALQAMLPKLATLCRHRAVARLDGTADDRFQSVIGEFWQVLGRYPTRRRPTRVAANLGMDTLTRLRAAARAVEVPVAPELLVSWDESAAPPPSPPGGLHADVSLSELLRWAVRRGVLAREDAQLLAAVYALRPDARGTYLDVAEAYRRQAEHSGTNPAALRQRVHRARRRLTVAAREALLTG